MDGLSAGIVVVERPQSLGMGIFGPLEGAEIIRPFERVVTRGGLPNLNQTYESDNGRIRFSAPTHMYCPWCHTDHLKLDGDGLRRVKLVGYTPLPTADMAKIFDEVKYEILVLSCVMCGRHFSNLMNYFGSLVLRRMCAYE